MVYIQELLNSHSLWSKWSLVIANKNVELDVQICQFYAFLNCASLIEQFLSGESDGVFFSFVPNKFAL